MAAPAKQAKSYFGRDFCNVRFGWKADVNSRRIKCYFMAGLKFLLALLLGSVVAAILAVAGTSPENATIWIVVGVATIFAMFGLIPSACLGTPALRMCQHLNFSHIAAASLLAMAGAALGASMMAFTFTSFESWGAIAGGSIGLMQGLLLYKR